MESPSHTQFTERSLEESYATMGLDSGSDWSVVHKAYLILAKKWHPDRIQADDELANEKIRELNKAYSCLKAYHRELRKADSDLTAADKAENESTGSPLRPTIQDVFKPEDPMVIVPRTKEGFRTHPKVAPKKRPKVKKKPEYTDPLSVLKRPSVLKAILIGTAGAMAISLVAIGVLIIAVQLFKKDPEITDKLKKRPVSKLLSEDLTNMFERNAANSQIDFTDDKNNSKPKHFTQGDSSEVVIDVQGYPDFTSDTVWYYGKSAIVFEQGRVMSWTSSSSNPLKGINGDENQ